MEKFLLVGNGIGDGNGFGYCEGEGDCYGYRYGGYEDGYGNGYCYGWISCDLYFNCVPGYGVFGRGFGYGGTVDANTRRRS